MKPSLRRMLVIALGAAVVAAAGAAFALRRELIPERSPAARGQEIAARAGCTGCHENAAGPRTQKMPSMFGESDPAEVREWIENGSAPPGEGEERKPIVMPGYRDRLSSAEIDDLVAHILLEGRARRIGRAKPGEELPVERGEALARARGCFDCHGELGQGGVANPGSLKGYIPGLFGDDFLALTNEGDPEWVRAWIRDGVPQAFLERRVLGFEAGRHFLERQVIGMPAYGPFLKEDELDVLVAYCIALNKGGPLGPDRLETPRRSP